MKRFSYGMFLVASFVVFSGLKIYQYNRYVGLLYSHQRFQRTYESFLVDYKRLYAAVLQLKSPLVALQRISPADEFAVVDIKQLVILSNDKDKGAAL
jgi:hypothetical protein